MQVVTITNADNANGNYDIELPPAYRGHPEALVQIEISGTATVQILGALDDDFSYVEVVAAVTANTLSPVAYVPKLRATVSGYASGDVIVKVLIPQSARA
jgi:hypothetical protein